MSNGPTYLLVTPDTELRARLVTAIKAADADAEIIQAGASASGLALAQVSDVHAAFIDIMLPESSGATVPMQPHGLSIAYMLVQRQAKLVFLLPHEELDGARDPHCWIRQLANQMQAAVLSRPASDTALRQTAVMMRAMLAL